MSLIEKAENLLNDYEGCSFAPDEGWELYRQLIADNKRLTAELANLREATKGRTFYHSDDAVNMEMGKLRAELAEAKADIDRFKMLINILERNAESAERERDFLVELCGKAAKWDKELINYAHTIGHIENVISNLRCDLNAEIKLHKQTQSRLARYEEGVEVDEFVVNDELLADHVRDAEFGVLINLPADMEGQTVTVNVRPIRAEGERG